MPGGAGGLGGGGPACGRRRRAACDVRPASQYMGPRRPSWSSAAAWALMRPRDSCEAVVRAPPGKWAVFAFLCGDGLEGWRHLDGDEERGAPQTRHLIGRTVCPMSGEIEDAAAAAWAIPARSGRRSPGALARAWRGRARCGRGGAQSCWPGIAPRQSTGGGRRRGSGGGASPCTRRAGGEGEGGEGEGVAGGGLSGAGPRPSRWAAGAAGRCTHIPWISLDRGRSILCAQRDLSRRDALHINAQLRTQDAQAQTVEKGETATTVRSQRWVHD